MNPEDMVYNPREDWSEIGKALSQWDFSRVCDRWNTMDGYQRSCYIAGLTGDTVGVLAEELMKKV